MLISAQVLLTILGYKGHKDDWLESVPTHKNKNARQIEVLLTHFVQDLAVKGLTFVSVFELNPIQLL